MVNMMNIGHSPMAEWGLKHIKINKNDMILSILVDTFISKISFPMQPGPEIGSISDA